MKNATNSTSTHIGSRAATMKAAVQHGYGSADVLTIERVDVPSIGDDQVLVRVRAASVNHADWVTVSGTPLIARLAFGLRTPKDAVRGKDVAGQVEQVGKDVRGFRVGDEVYGELGSGAFSEYAVATAEQLTPKPANLTFEQAATVPLAANTALQGLRDAGRLVAGQRVLINGASGGVGTFAVQLAKALGAEVTAVGSSRNVELLRSLGADNVIDYTAEDFTATGQRYDLIFDLIGNHPLVRCRRALTRTGTLVLSSGTGSRMLGPLGRMLRALAMAPFVSQRLVAVWTPSTERSELLRELLEAGSVIPIIDRSYPLAETPSAIRHFAEVHARGKIVITL